MTVRIKILAISAVLLVLFAAVLIGSVVMQRQSRARLAAIIDVHLPLAATIAGLDVATYEYELVVERLLRRPVPSAVSEADRGALERASEHIHGGFTSAREVVDRALSDPRTDADDRLVLARVQRSLVYLGRMEAITSPSGRR